MLLGCGIGQPFVTTDYPAVQRAIELNADAILIAKHGTDGVYSGDPRTDPTARKYRTLGYQATRSSPFSVWGQAPGLDFLQPVARVLAVALALGVALYPRFKTPVQIAALAVVVTIAVQLTASHWFYFYVVWFLPFALVASFGSQERILASGDRRPQPPELR